MAPPLTSPLCGLLSQQTLSLPATCCTSWQTHISPNQCRSRAQVLFPPLIFLFLDSHSVTPCLVVSLLRPGRAQIIRLISCTWLQSFPALTDNKLHSLVSHEEACSCTHNCSQGWVRYALTLTVCHRQPRRAIRSRVSLIYMPECPHNIVLYHPTHVLSPLSHFTS